MIWKILKVELFMTFYLLFIILIVILVCRFQFVKMEKLISEFALSFPVYKISIKVRKVYIDQE